MIDWRLEEWPIRCVWQIDGARVRQLAVTNLHSEQVRSI